MTAHTVPSAPRLAWWKPTEDRIQVLILLAIGSMAGAASFTHMHDWTMDHAPVGTHDWFGWANAVISELTPLAAGLEMRRRRRVGQPVGYPMVVLLAAVALSLSAQIAQANPSISSRLLSAVPAIAFLAVVKLVLGRTRADRDSPAPAASVRTTQDGPAPVPARPRHDQDDQDETATVPLPAGYPRPALPADLLDRARTAAADHTATTGRPITRDALRAALGVSNGLASDLLAAIRQDDARTSPQPVLPVPVSSPSVLTGPVNGTRPSPEGA